MIEDDRAPQLSAGYEQNRYFKINPMSKTIILSIPLAPWHFKQPEWSNILFAKEFRSVDEVGPR